MKLCKYCTNKLVGRQTKFCSTTCNTLWRYHNIPSVNKKKKEYARKQGKRKRQEDPKYRKEQAKRFKKWRKENREHFNKLVKGAPSYKKMIKRQIEKRKRFRKEGLCGKCGKVKSVTYSCEDCNQNRRLKNGNDIYNLRSADTNWLNLFERY